ncbi:hypothetical protein Rumeso_01343 [Rubellimicrobium mesophilum DSM 19309]|uniref:Uncharacterized protein n=1 Tax=Rubellimicrobium mesophilum DSM 19309 TaxID=442562 RepID=A0A017HTN8_9RHOB|nr:hypothetical protein [Rubellimicrobium mesophilum]EYD77084.1 hypothetical protein Rumeso_01343 [Rubellimicrobium mesophilum DSM 19309]
MSQPGATNPSEGREDILPFEVRQAFWGYVIRGTAGPPILVQVAQGLVLSLGAACAAAALAVAALTPDDAGGLSLMRLGASAVLMAFALLFLRYASRGGVVELHVDLARGELREVVRHRVGRASTLGAHGFDPSASLHIRRDGAGGGHRTLILHHRGSRDGLCIAQGPEHALQTLRRRLEHDIRLHAGARPIPVLA